MLLFSDRCVELIKRYEGFRARPYWGDNGPSIGYGSRIYPDGTRVSMDDLPISLGLALQMLLDQLNREVHPYLSKWIKVPLTQEQVDALGCLIHEVTLSRFKSSEVLKAINRGVPLSEIQAAWMHFNKSRGRIHNHLIARRKEEFKLYASS